MIYDFEQRVSDAPFVDKVWRATVSGKGEMLLQAKHSMDIIFARDATGVSSMVVGAATYATKIQYDETMEYVGISFMPGVYIPNISGYALTNTSKFLPQINPDMFELRGERVEIPTYSNVEMFVALLKNQGVLGMDTIVANALEGKPLVVSTRSMQRHFLKTTGLTYNFTQQIARARYAASLLETGSTIAAATYEAGYADQAHMAKSFRRILGKNPSEI